MAANGSTVREIWEKLQKMRARKEERVPTLNNVRRAIKGLTHKRGVKETRGRKKKMTAVNIRAVNKARLELQKQSGGEYEVTLGDIKRKTRIRVDRSTISRALFTGVASRAPYKQPDELGREGFYRTCRRHTRRPSPMTIHATVAHCTAWWRESFTTTVMSRRTVWLTYTLLRRSQRGTDGKRLRRLFATWA
jgi:hypothetical protein